MAELRFFHGTKEQYNKVASKSNKDFYVTHEVREISGESKEWLSLWLGDQLIGGAESYEMLVNEIKAREAADAQMADNLAKAIEELESKIGQTSADKTYSIVAITEGLGANVAEAFKLVDGNGVQAGETINIYKDSALKSVALDGQELVFTYILADGSESVVRIDVSSFLHESEYGDGLQVVDHVVSIKKDDESDDFLTVSEKGVKVSGIRAALDAAREEAKAGLNEAIEAEVSARTAADKALAADLAAEIARADAAEKANAAAITAESDRAKKAEGDLDAKLSAEIARAEAAEGALNAAEKANAAAIAAEEARAVAAEALLRANAVINVKAVDHSAVHVSVDGSENGKVVSVGMAWMNIAYEAASEGELNAAFAAAEPEVRLAADVTLSAPVHASAAATTFDLNNQVLTNQVNNAQTDVILVDPNATLKIEGDGKVIAVSGNDGYPVIVDGVVEIYSGYFESGVDAKGLTNACVYARGNGHAIIYGGEFHSADGAYVLNIKDSDRATAKIEVKGGRFYGFNPADNASEGPDTNFVAPGYVSVEVEPNVWEVMLKA